MCVIVLEGVGRTASTRNIFIEGLELYLQESWDPHLKCSEQVYDECMYRTLAGLMLNSTGEERCTAPWVLENRRICRQQDNVRTTFEIAWNRSVNMRKFTKCTRNRLMANFLMKDNKSGGRLSRPLRRHNGADRRKGGARGEERVARRSHTLLPSPRCAQACPYPIFFGHVHDQSVEEM